MDRQISVCRPRAISPWPAPRVSSCVLVARARNTHGRSRIPGLKEHGKWSVQTKMLKHLMVNVK